MNTRKDDRERETQYSRSWIECIWNIHSGGNVLYAIQKKIREAAQERGGVGDESPTLK